jgi:hypothetical protein
MVTIAGGGSLDLTTSLSLGEQIVFLNTPASGGILTVETTALENTTFTVGSISTTLTGLGGYIAGFQPGDSIVLRDLATDYAIFDHAPNAASQNAAVASNLQFTLFGESATHETEVITLSGTGIVTDNLGLVGGTDAAIGSYAAVLEQALFGTHAQTADMFVTIAADPSNSSMADAIISTDGEMVVCYLRGTNILTAAGERPIESLVPGDLVITHSCGARPVKWIGLQSFGARFVARNRDRLPVKIAAGALGDHQPMRDLYVSPGHSLLLNGQLVLARDLVNGVTVTQPAREEDTHYYLVELDTHDCVVAEGVWAETYADAPGLRGQFHNITDFRERFPDYITPDTLQLYAPRPEAGPDWEAPLRRVLERTQAESGPLRGFVDLIGETIEGWALDDANPELPVLVEIFTGSEKLGDTLARLYRRDLEAAGLGAGRCKFSFPLPAALSASARAQLRVIRAADGAPLHLTEGCRAA